MNNIKTIVMKFGGTSVASVAARELMMRHIVREVTDGYKVLVVVSAIGRLGSPYATDSLGKLVTEKITDQESDRLLSCGEIISSIVVSNLARQNDLRATSLAPGELGITTDNNYRDAGIVIVEIGEILKRFNEYDVLVAPGFIGISEDGNITTLGRGGSDTSAIALGASLGADFIDIYSDVVGIMTADPKVDPDATLISTMTYDELVEMAENGAKIIHLKAIKIARDCEVNVRFRSTFEDFVGTVISKERGGNE